MLRPAQSNKTCLMDKGIRQKEHVGGSSPSIKNLCHPGMTSLYSGYKQSGPIGYKIVFFSNFMEFIHCI